jgi:hypothetical protein
MRKIKISKKDVFFRKSTKKGPFLGVNSSSSQKKCEKVVKSMFFSDFLCFIKTIFEKVTKK